MRRDIKKKQEILKEMPDGLAKQNLSGRIDALVARWTDYEEYLSESRYRWLFWLALTLFPLQISSEIQWLSSKPSWFPINWFTVPCTVLGLSAWGRFLFWNFNGKTMDGQVPDAALVRKMRKRRIQRRINNRIRARKFSTCLTRGAIALAFPVLVLQGRAHRSEWGIFIDCYLYRVYGVTPPPNSDVWKVCRSIDQIEDVRLTSFSHRVQET